MSSEYKVCISLFSLLDLNDSFIFKLDGKLNLIHSEVRNKIFTQQYLSNHL